MKRDMNKRGVILVSGGLDSIVLLAYLAHKDYELYALSFDYGQRGRYEIELAQRHTAKYGVVKHWVQRVDLPWGGSSLTDITRSVVHGLPEKGGVPGTYVPCRNTIFLSFALSCAEALEINKVFIGANELDFANYPDCRKSYFDSYNALVSQAVPNGIRGNPMNIEVPFINFSKSEIVSIGHSLGVDFSLTLSCYSPVDDELACGHCSSCLFRSRAFEQASVVDTTRYANCLESVC